ncbi:MAG: hypothetical protein ACI395_00490 [Candidatus Cryptobacteroides sp.]
MKVIKYVSYAIIALAISASCDKSANGDKDNVKPEVKYVSSIDFRYTSVAENDSKHCTFTYRYDEQDRVVRIEEVSESQFSYDSYEVWHTLDYTIVDKVTVTSAYKDDYREDEIYDVTLQNGRATESSVVGGSSYSYEPYKFTFNYNDAGYLVGIVDYSEDDGEKKTDLSYTGGLLTGVTREDDGETQKLSFPVDTYYPHRYPNDRTNVDFNMFLFNGHPELAGDILSILASLRMCGKYGDACVEMLEEWGDDYAHISAAQYTKDPNYTEHMSETRESMKSGPWSVAYEFNESGCPVQISFDTVYELFKIEYDLVADTGNPIPHNPYGGAESGNEVWYPIITKNFTEEKTSEVNCPAVFTITYKE